jgi:hypothetical protein
VNSSADTLELIVPLGRPPAHDAVDPSPRPRDLNLCSVHLVLSMPHGSGMEPWWHAAAADLGARFPRSCLVRLVRDARYMGDDPAQRAAIANAAHACVVYFGSPAGALNLVAARYCCELERAGVPAVLVVPEHFAAAMRRACAVLRCPLHIIAVDPAAPPQAIATALWDRLTIPAAAPTARQAAAPTVRVDAADAQALTAREGWSDGLPLHLPTPHAVDVMLSGTQQDPQRCVSSALGPSSLSATVRLVAANAVMAGARPRDMPLLLAATEALGRNEAIRPMLSSVNGFCFPFLVNGPIRAQCELETGTASIGASAHRAIERALALILQNLADVRAGETAFAVQGNPARLSFLIVENEEASPWASYSQDRGATATASRLTLFGGGWSHVGTYFYPEDGVERLGAALAHFEMPHSALVLLSPARARLLAGSATGKADVAEAIRLHTRVSLGAFRRSGYYAGRIRDRIVHEHTWPAEYLDASDDAIVAAYPPGGIRIVVAGGEGAPVMTAWKLEELATASPDDWQ